MTGLLETVEQYVQDELKQVDCSHDWNHICRVRRNSLFILEKEQTAGRFDTADRTVVEIAALMHDVGDYKYTKDHAAGPRMVRAFLAPLTSLGITEEQIEKVVLVVANISFRHELSHGMASDLPEELKIVQDADRLDAIGAVGIARCFAFSGARNVPFYCASDVLDGTLTAEQYNRQALTGGGSAVAHFYEKLFRLKTMMKTETGRAEAQKRHQFMTTFIRTIEAEAGICGGPIPE